jgi:hypothetical protein
MKRLAGTITLIFVSAVLVAGCHATANAAAGTQPGSSTTAGGSNKAGGATYAKAAPLSNQVTTAPINDPSMNNMQAVTMTIPAGWKLEGTIQGNPCANGGSPWPVYRAYSPDGLMQVVSEPLLGWRWETNGSAVAGSNSGCANIKGKISAADFIQYYVGTIQGGVHTVGSMTVPAAVQQQNQQLVANANQTNQQLSGGRQGFGFTTTGDTAALRIEVVNGSFVVEERVVAALICGVNNMSISRQANTCFAELSVDSAPEGQLDPLVQDLDNGGLPKITVNPQWQQVVLAQLHAQTQKYLQMESQMAAQTSAALSRMFQQSQQMLNQNHQQFMAQQESQFESAMNNANAQMNAQSTAASDWVDYALDQQTVANPDGSTTKVSSAYSQTWTNGTQWYQTNDPNANPNGVLAGNWSQTMSVHGNGTPK